MTEETAIDFSALPNSAFTDALGLQITEASGTSVRGYADLGPQHHQPQGLIHGGVYCAIVESAASVGAAAAVFESGTQVVGVHNGTDFLRGISQGRVLISAEPLHQGRSQQLWLVEITEESSGKPVARGQVRLQNLTPRATPPTS